MWSLGHAYVAFRSCFCGGPVMFRGCLGHVFCGVSAMFIGNVSVMFIGSVSIMFRRCLAHIFCDVSVICLPGLSLVVSALFRLCSISIHLSARSVTAGVRPFPLAM